MTVSKTHILLNVRLVEKVASIATNAGSCLLSYKLVVVVVNDIAIGAVGFELGPRTGQVGHSVANGLRPLRCFFATGYTLVSIVLSV